MVFIKHLKNWHRVYFVSKQLDRYTDGSVAAVLTNTDWKKLFVVAVVVVVYVVGRWSSHLGRCTQS